MTVRKRVIHGVGVVDIPRPTRSVPDIYKIWVAMINRCYNPKVHSRQPTYENCVVDPSWFNLSDFVMWALLQDYCDKELDKDILVTGNTIYGPSTCLFVTKEINNALHTANSYRGRLPCGVSEAIQKKRNYMVHMRKKGNPVFLGYFNTVEEASRHYLRAKSQYIEELASKTKCPRTASSLFRISREIRSGTYYK